MRWPLRVKLVQSLLEPLIHEIFGSVRHLFLCACDLIALHQIVEDELCLLERRVAQGDLDLLTSALGSMVSTCLGVNHMFSRFAWSEVSSAALHRFEEVFELLCTLLEILLDLSNDISFDVFERGSSQQNLPKISLILIIAVALLLTTLVIDVLFRLRVTL